MFWLIMVDYLKKKGLKSAMHILLWLNKSQNAMKIITLKSSK